MPSPLHVHASLDALDAATTVVFAGRRAQLLDAAVLAALPDGVDPILWRRMVERTDPGDDGRVTSTWTGADRPERLVAAVLPERCSRHNTPTRAWGLHRTLASMPRRGPLGIVVVAAEDAHVDALALSLARAFPAWSGVAEPKTLTTHVAFATVDGDGLRPRADAERLATMIEAVRLAAALTDRPTNDLHTDAFVAEAEAVAQRHEGVGLTVIRGTDLRDGGFGGLWGVGKAATHPPALVALTWRPEDPTGHDAWVGKGIVYDTGGLSIKGKTTMPGMKADMGGAAAVLGAFEAAVALGARRAITAVLCLAENSVGPASTRPDDILHMKSGRTVEVNNTDAEGRLVLADGLAWVAADDTVDRFVDLATLTGAQLVATGKRFAAVVCNDDTLEATAVDLGRRTGDLVHPLPYCPEFYFREFQSKVADMKNSVKDRSNGQSSCAAEFVRRHLPADDTRPWLHVDLAGPSKAAGRGTGFGVGLLLGLAGVAGRDAV